MIDRFNNGEPKNDKQLEVGNLEGYQSEGYKRNYKKVGLHKKKWVLLPLCFRRFLKVESTMD